jgi:hypothetical protein
LHLISTGILAFLTVSSAVRHDWVSVAISGLGTMTFLFLAWSFATGRATKSR